MAINFKSSPKLLSIDVVVFQFQHLRIVVGGGNMAGLQENTFIQNRILPNHNGHMHKDNV